MVSIVRKVRCSICGWLGTTDDLIYKFKTIEKSTGIIYLEATIHCPECGDEEIKLR